MKANINNPVILHKEISFDKYENRLRRAINILAKREIRRLIKNKVNKKFVVFVSDTDMFLIKRKKADKLKFLN